LLNRVDDEHVLAARILSQSNPPELGDAVLIVRNRERQRIAKDFGSSLEIHSMFGEVAAKYER